jgi:hypothetical protein
MTRETMLGLMLMSPLVALTVSALAFFFGEVLKDWRRARQARR